MYQPIFSGSTYQIGTHVHSVTTSRNLASVTFCESPEKGIGKSIFFQVGEHLIVDFEFCKFG